MARNKGIYAIQDLKELCRKARYWGVYEEAKTIMIDFLKDANVIEPAYGWRDNSEPLRSPIRRKV